MSSKASYLTLLTTIIISLLVIPVGSAFAGAPFVTDDPEPVEVQHLEVNYALSKTWQEDGASASLPSMDINYGFSPNIQLHAQPKYAYEREGHEKNDGFEIRKITVKSCNKFKCTEKIKLLLFSFF